MRLQARSRRVAKAGLSEWHHGDIDLAELAARDGRFGEAEDEARRLRRELLESGDVPAATQAGVLLASVLLARRADGAAERLLDELDVALAKHPDALLALRADLVRANTGGDSRRIPTRVADRARESGFEWLALRAELLAGGEIGAAAQATLLRLGIPAQPLRPFAY